MIEQIQKKINNSNFDKSKHISRPFFDIYYPLRKNLLKNYIIAPDVKIIK